MGLDRPAACTGMTHRGSRRETFGAAVATYQAAVAADPEIAAVMQQIAEDETRHAALAQDIAAWAEPRLGAAQRAELEQARRRAIDELRAEIETRAPAEVHALAGVPEPAVARDLLDRLEAALWS